MKNENEATHIIYRNLPIRKKWLYGRIAEIAKAAEVNYHTVQKAIKGTDEFTDDTHSKILNAILTIQQEEVYLYESNRALLLNTDSILKKTANT